jgi:hypothetical protein
MRDHAAREIDIRIAGELDRHAPMHALGRGEIRRDSGLAPSAGPGAWCGRSWAAAEPKARQVKPIAITRASRLKLCSNTFAVLRRMQGMLEIGAPADRCLYHCARIL